MVALINSWRLKDFVLRLLTALFAGRLRSIRLQRLSWDANGVVTLEELIRRYLHSYSTKLLIYHPSYLPLLITLQPERLLVLP
jgi:hypothetical protein